jgi:hypothetical protein
MSKFLSELKAHLLDDDKVWALDEPLIYESDLLKCTITVPAGFNTDFASVPRVPFAYMFFGDKAHREAILHDYCYRKNSIPIVTESQANNLFFEAMTLRGKPAWVRYTMYWGVCLGGWTSFHKFNVEDSMVGKL